MTNFMSNLGIGKGSDTSTQSLQAVGFLNYYDPDLIAWAGPKFTILTEAACTSDNIGAAFNICSVPDDHIDPRRLALFMARSLLREIRDGGTDACSTA
jgi:hypothetical protein